MKIRNKPTSDNLSPKFEVRMGKISAIMSIYTKKKTPFNNKLFI